MPDMSDFSLNDPFRHPNISFNNYKFFSAINCFLSTPSSFIVITFTITNIFISLPFCILILYHGVQQWKQTRSTCSATKMSHSDSFTYHMVTLMLIGVLGCVLCCFGTCNVHVNTLQAGIILYTFTCYGEIFFQYLTCVERYLAVVHPITYLSLKNERGTMIRNISIGCTWLLSFLWTALVMIQELLHFLNSFILFLSLTVIPFCSLSVLCVLMRPGPRERGVNREKVDRSKQRALYTMLAILGVLLLRFTWGLIWTILLTKYTNCVAVATGLWFNLPCTLLLPVLFVQKKRKMCACFKNNTQ